jgi:hypothetical protein
MMDVDCVALISEVNQLSQRPHRVVILLLVVVQAAFAVFLHFH